MWYISSCNDLLIANMTYQNVELYNREIKHSVLCSFKGALHPLIVAMYTLLIGPTT